MNCLRQQKQKQRAFGKDITNILPSIQKAIQDVKISDKYNVRYTYDNKPNKIVYNKIQSEIKLQNQQKVKDPQMIQEYSNDISKYMIQRQKQSKCNSKIITVNHNNSFLQKRIQVVNWMVDIHRKSKLFPHTLYMSIWIMDKCLSTGKYSNRIDQLSIVSLFISAKYEQTYRVPKLKDLIQSNRQCNKKQSDLYNLQAEVTSQMNFNFVYDSSYRFLQMIAKNSNMSLKNFHLAQFIIQIAFLDVSYMNFSSSLIGCAAYYLISKVRKVQQPWPINLFDLTGYNQKDLQHCAKNLLSIYESINYSNNILSNAEYIKNKFSSVEYSYVTNFKLQRKKSIN